MKMIEMLQRIVDAIRPSYDPDPHRRKEVIKTLSGRVALSDTEWHNRYAKADGISVEFTSWYRKTCSKYFEYDLSGALPDDRLVEDLGLFYATWSDVDWDIMEDFRGEFGADLEETKLKEIRTYGELLKYAWERSHIPENKIT